jgi:hypothetical protein
MGVWGIAPSCLMWCIWKLLLFIMYLFIFSVILLYTSCVREYCFNELYIAYHKKEKEKKRG